MFDNKQTVNQRIKILRTELALTQLEFANTIGVTQTALSHIESGRNGISYDVFLNIIRTFSVNPFWIMEGKGHMFNIDEKISKAEDNNEAELIKVIGLGHHEFERHHNRTHLIYERVKSRFPKLKSTLHELSHIKSSIDTLSYFLNEYYFLNDLYLSDYFLDNPNELNIDSFYKDNKEKIDTFFRLQEVLTPLHKQLENVMNQLKEVDSKGLLKIYQTPDAE